VQEIKSDIDAMRSMADEIRTGSWKMRSRGDEHPRGEQWMHMAFLLRHGPKTAFLQDANSMIMKPGELAEVLRYLKDKFPSIERITTYSRSHTVARRSIEELKELHSAGLSRIHIGMESGSDEVLKMIQKGVTGADHIIAGRNVKEAGMELSEYIMPGLGGKLLTGAHAGETARVLNEIRPDFIRMRTLAIPPGAPLFEKWKSGEFIKLSDDGVVEEIRILISRLECDGAVVVSDHILNLIEEVEGRIPGDRAGMLEVIDRYLSMESREKLIFKIGRRLGRLRNLDDLEIPSVRAELEDFMVRLEINDEESYEARMAEFMTGLI